MRRLTQSIVACLLALTSLAALGTAPLGHAQTLEQTLTTCDWAHFKPALDAIQARGGGTLVLDCQGEIEFAGQQIITTNVRIIGNGATLDGRGETRLFWITSGARLALVGLTLQDGNAGSNNGGVIINYGTLEVVNSTFTGNSAWEGGTIYNAGDATITAGRFISNSAVESGGAIRNGTGAPGTSATLTINASEFIGNSARYGGAIYNDALNPGWAHATIRSSTFSGNSAAFLGRAITARGNSAPVVTLEIETSTFSGNDAGGAEEAIYSLGAIVEITASTLSGSGAALSGVQTASWFLVRSSILAGSTDDANCEHPVTSLGYNLSDDESCGFTTEGDRQGADVNINLGPLQLAGGLTPTLAPTTGSDAIDAIPQQACMELSTPTDQRGVPRPTNGSCEIGAVEIGAVPVQLIDIFNSGPILQGNSAHIIATASGPLGASLSYQFDCDDDGEYEISQSSPWAQCSFPAGGDQTVGVRVTDGTSSASGETTVNVIRTVPSITGLQLDPTPSDEGAEVELTVTFLATSAGGAHSCEIDWGDLTTETVTVDAPEESDSCTASHVYVDGDEDYQVTVKVCAGPDLCDQIDETHTVLNVAPTIEQILIDPNPVQQGEPVTVTIIAGDPGNDELRYSIDCDADGTFEYIEEPSNTAVCELDPAQASPTITVTVFDDEGASTTDSAFVSQVVSLCANRYTGQLGSTLAIGSCPPTSTALILPQEEAAMICVDRYTGELIWAPRGTCSPAHAVHVAPDDGPLAYCQNRYTGQLRYTPTGACSPVERKGVIPG